MKTIKNWTLFILLLIVQSSFGQDASFTANVSKRAIGVNQRIRVEFSINLQGADNFTPPSFKDFKIVAGPSQSVNQSWINGKNNLFKKIHLCC